MSAEALPPEVETAAASLDATAAESGKHAAQLQQFHLQYRGALAKAHQHKIKPATFQARLRPETRRLLLITEATFGRTRSLISSLEASPWKLGVHELQSSFDETVLGSEDFLCNLRDYASSTTSWEDARNAIIRASESRRSGTGRRPGVSLERAFVPQDVRDAANATAPGRVKFRKKTRTQAKKRKAAGQQEDAGEHERNRYAKQPLPPN